MKKCGGPCKLLKSLSCFTKDKRQKDGLDRRCKDCKAANYARIDKEHRKAWRKQYYEKNKESELHKCAEYRNLHREERSRYIAEYYKKFPERGAAKTAKYRANKLKATPIWITDAQLDQMVVIYENCPDGCHVDHIIPLQGKLVKGLHVPWNLQYLPAKENQRKGNRINLQEWSTPTSSWMKMYAEL